VKQLRITETAQQIVKDWDTLSRAGANASGIMRKAIQELVTDALKLGGSLPEAMRPILQALVDSGELTDEFGNKLTDLSRLNFETPLSQKIGELVDALRDLIDVFSDVGTAAEEGFGRARGAAEALGRAIPRGSTGAGAAGGDEASSGTATSRAASGGLVGRSRVLPFRSLGTDTVPAWLTPKEMVLNEDQQAALGAVIGSAMRGLPYAGSSLAGLRATGTDGQPAAPAPSVVNVTHQHTWHALDGDSVRKVVAGREFNEQFKANLTRDTHGVRTHVKDVTA